MNGIIVEIERLDLILEKNPLSKVNYINNKLTP